MEQIVSKQEKQNFFWNLVGLSLNNFNSLFFLVIVKRINGIEQTGMFSFGYAVACFVYVASLFYNRTFQLSNNTFSNSFFVKFRMVSCFFFLLLALLLAFFSSNSLRKFFITVLLCVFRILESLSDVFYGIVHKKNNLVYVGKSLSVKSVIGVLVFFILDYFYANVLISILGLVFVNVIGVLIDFLVANKIDRINFSEKNLTSKKVNTLLKESFGIFIFSVLGMLILNAQKYIFGFLNQDNTGAIFNIIVMPATIMALVGQYFINPFINKFVFHYRENDKKGFSALFNKLLVVLFAIGLFVCFCAWLFGIKIMEIIFAISLSDYTLLICLVIFSSIFYSLSNLCSSCLTVMNFNNMQSVIYIITAFFTFLFSIVLILKKDLTGSVLGYFISMIMLFSLYLLFFLFKINRWKVKNG